MNMSLSSIYRFITVANLFFRNEEKVSVDVDKYEFSEIKEIIEKQYKLHDTKYRFDRETKQIRIKEIRDYQDSKNNKYLCILLSIGDKNAANAAYEHFETYQTRQIEKEEEEGNALTSHLLIKESPLDNYHLTLIEKVNGLSINTISRYLNYLFKQSTHLKEYPNKSQHLKKYRPIFEFCGYQSNTIRKALESGTLEDIEFFSHEIVNDGLDEENYIQEKKQKITLVVKPGIETNTVDSLLRKMVNKFRTEKHEKMFIKIKNLNCSTKTTEINTDIDLETESVLDQVFVHTEIISNFSQPLEQAHSEIRDDLVQKMLNIAQKL